MTHVVLTGASGFVGAHALRHFLTETDWTIACPVSFRHHGMAARIASTLDNLPADIHPYERTSVTVLDLACPVDQMAARTLRLADAEFIFNLASESHVDRSIETPRPFIENNVGVALAVLEAARTWCPNLRALFMFSTDEVYGPVAPGYDSQEWDPILPSNPYSASKAMQEAAAIAYWRTYEVPLIITNTMNCVGEMQDPEKFLPLLIRAALTGKKVQIHGSPDGAPGSRKYIHSRNVADGLLFLARTVTKPIADRAGLVYGEGADRPLRFNLVGEEEIDNLAMAHLVAGMVGKRIRTEVVAWHQSRPGHDLRYSLDGSRMEVLGWKPPLSLRASLIKTVQWYLDHPEWLDLDPTDYAKPAALPNAE